MDPVRIPESPDPLPVGDSIFIPFESFNICPNGSHDSKIAVDLPPMKTIHNARLYLWNTPGLADRAIDYQEYSIAEIQNDAAVYAYLQQHKGAL